MTDTATIYACGFPDEKLFNDVIDDERTRATVLTKEQLFALQNIDEHCVLFIYCSTFETYLIEFLNLIANKLPKNPIVIIGENFSQSYLQNIFEHHSFTYITLPSDKEKIISALVDAQNGICAYIPKINYEKQLKDANFTNVALKEVGVALTAETNLEKLLDLILYKVRRSVKADAGSLYIKEDDNHIRFVFSQNISTDWSGKQNMLMEINDKSIAGYTALSKQPLNILDVYSFPKSFPFTFNKSYDLSTGYRNKSMLTVPMCNKEGELLGVIQLINKRKDYERKVTGKKLEENQIIPFNNTDIELSFALASQAAIALENTKLYQDIRQMFEGFVKASNVAIEAKDPCTRGHSERVAKLTVALAKAVNDCNEGPFANIKFNDKELLQIKYAALLHDFGKVSVSDEVLTKSKKLYPYELENLKLRYNVIRKSIEADYNKDCLDYIEKNGLENFKQEKEKMDNSFQKRLKELDETVELLVKSNEPTVLEEGCSNRIAELANSIYKDRDGNEIPYLTERERSALSVKRGSLTENERQEIESHVTHSYNFLSKIPWANNLSRVPEIAFAHHEKLNGKGYPKHMVANEIPIESQIMGITDIFDALTAQDRPYKPALPLAKALNILQMDAKNNALNKDLVDLFESKEVYKCLDETFL